MKKSEYAALNEFVEDGLAKRFTSNKTIVFGPLLVFVRVATHYLDGALTRTLDIGRIDVQPKQQGKGVFSKFLNHAERLAHKNGLVIYVESIMNDELKSALQKRGYEINGEDICPNAHFNTAKLCEKYKHNDDTLSL